MHRAESILQALTTRLTGLATTGANVQRGWVDQLDAVPGLIVRMGQDGHERNVNMAIDRLLEVDIESVVRAGADADTRLNQIRAEVYAALQADRTLGLPWVLDLVLLVDSAPTQRDNAVPLVRQVQRYAIHYRHSPTSTES